MIKLLVIAIMVLCALLVFSAPWLTSLAYIGLSTLQPQHIWFWAFRGFSIFNTLAIISVVAWGIMAVRGKLDFTVYKNKETLAMVVIAAAINLSEFATPFIEYQAGVSSEIIISNMNVITIMYFLVLPMLNHRKAVKYLTVILMCAIGYYIYESNSNYFAGDWSKFSSNRYTGMDTGPYDDGNVYAILIAMLYPFLFLTLKYSKTLVVKGACLAVLPFLFNSLFLTGSRGAFIAIVLSTIVMAFILKSKKLNIALYVTSFSLIIWQGGVMLDRTKSTISSINSTTNIEQINPRVTTWLIGLELTSKYPLLGVGPQRFETARDFHFPERARTVAHNTYLALSSQSGIFAGIALLVIIYRRLKTIFISPIADEALHDDLIDYIIRASGLSILIYAIGAMFLDMIIFEVFYFMVILNISACYIRQKSLDAHDALDSPNALDSDEKQ